MLHAILTLTLLLQGQMKVVEPVDDLVITESVQIKPGTYRVKDEGEPGILRIEGENVVVVMSEVILIGSEEGALADSYSGTGVVFSGKGNILWGGEIHGFKVGVHAEGLEDSWIVDVNVDDNYAQRLASTPAAEDAGDWLWPHENDEAQWAKNYGAGIWVRNSRGVRILDCQGHHSQNGLLLDRSTGCLVRGCNFAFHSGWGIALWRSSDNRIEQNTVDWCVRGYSHGIYARGQDSAGILVFEQSHRNIFRQNSATHCGDGFFLYAGHETTKKTGGGGCNDNLVQENDFSHAVANGIEATFSTGNRFLANRVDDCNYGIWAGYSRESAFERNLARGCTYAGIAIEHGSGNVIRGNLIEDCWRAVQLWWDEDKDFLEGVFGQKNRTD